MCNRAVEEPRLLIIAENTQETGQIVTDCRIKNTFREQPKRHSWNVSVVSKDLVKFGEKLQKADQSFSRSRITTQKGSRKT